MRDVGLGEERRDFLKISLCRNHSENSDVLWGDWDSGMEFQAGEEPEGFFESGGARGGGTISGEKRFSTEQKIFKKILACN